MTSRIQVWLGVDGVRAAYERSLRESELSIMCMSQGYERVLGDYFDQAYAPRLYGKIKTREILPDKPENREYANGKDGKLNQVKFTNSMTSETDMLIGRDWVALISFDLKAPVAVVAEEAELVRALRGQFEIMWKGLK